MVAAATVVVSSAGRTVLDAIPRPSSEVPILAFTSAAGAAFTLQALPMKRVATRDNGDRRGDFGCEQSNKRRGKTQGASHSQVTLSLTHPPSLPHILVIVPTFLAIVTRAFLSHAAAGQRTPALDRTQPSASRCFAAPHGLLQPSHSPDNIHYYLAVYSWSEAMR